MTDESLSGVGCGMIGEVITRQRATEAKYEVTMGGRRGLR